MSTLLDSGFNNTLFFYGGPLSQWAHSPFQIELHYSTAEQYMMAMKAIHFGDVVAYNRINNSSSPREQKAIGRTVKNFNVEEWNKVSRSHVFRGNVAKFQQNPRLRDYILSTGERELVEASPTDVIWGIGLAEHDPLIYDRTNWRGTNWLGEVLMQVRTFLRKGSQT